MYISPEFDACLKRFITTSERGKCKPRRQAVQPNKTVLVEVMLYNTHIYSFTNIKFQTKLRTSRID